jgi:hypothetical protein
MVEPKYPDMAKKAEAGATAELKQKVAEWEAGKAPPRKQSHTLNGACGMSKEAEATNVDDAACRPLVEGVETVSNMWLEPSKPMLCPTPFSGLPPL